MHPEVDFYGVLGVARDATASEIRRAFRRLARQQHPDLNSDPTGPRRFAVLAEAYQTLRDPAQRARYDRLHAPAAGPPRSSHRQTAQPSRMGEQTLRGILELSPDEAAFLSVHRLSLHDGHGQAIVLPAGTRHGDQLAVLHHGHPAVLTVRVRAEP